MQELPGHEGRSLQVEHSRDDVGDSADTSEWMQTGEGAEILVGVHRGVDDIGRYRVHPDSLVRVLDCKGFGDGCHAAFGERGQHRRYVGVGEFDQGGGHVHDVSAIALGEHLGDDVRGEVKEAGQVHRGDQGVVLGGVAGERLGDEDAGVVVERIHPPEPTDRGAHELFGDRRIGNVARNGDHTRVSAGLIVREFATTA